MRAPERGGRSDGARYWCNARLELLVAEGRYEDAVEAADEYARASRHYHNPAAARWSSLKAVALDALGHEAQGDRARRRGARPRARLGRARHRRALAARARPARGRRGARAPRGGGRGRRPSAPARLELAKSLAALGVTRRRAGRPDYAREPLAARARAGRGVRRRAPARPRSAPRCSPSASSPRSADAARRGVADRDRAARRRAGRRRPRRARDRPGAVRHPAHRSRSSSAARCASSARAPRASSPSRWKPDGNASARSGQRVALATLPAMTIIDPARDDLSLLVTSVAAPSPSPATTATTPPARPSTSRVDQRPAAVAYPADADEVAEVVRSARAAGLRVAAQTTGHNAGPLGDLSAHDPGQDARAWAASRSTPSAGSPASAPACCGRTSSTPPPRTA